jgi:hypothetical protein
MLELLVAAANAGHRPALCFQPSDNVRAFHDVYFYTSFDLDQYAIN